MMLAAISADHRRWRATAPVLCALLAACGGSGSSGPGGTPNPLPTRGPPTATSVQAATDTATGQALCVGGNGAAAGTDLRPFYWEIGDAAGALVSGSVTAPGTRPTTAATVMSIASASKWIYSSYWAQRTRGELTADDVRFFNFWSGYTNLSSCADAATVGSCLDIVNVNGTLNGSFDPATAGRFSYDSGHMQVHAATVAGLGALDNAGLAAEMQSQIGTDVDIRYSQPELAGGGFTSAAAYATMLRKLLGGELTLGSLLGSHPVCVDPASCPLALRTPSPPREKWHYSIGHWVEDDPIVGDGAFSSPGALGFYPWIDRSKSYYGVVARVEARGALDSVYCGRLIRKAWLTGVVQ